MLALYLPIGEIMVNDNSGKDGVAFADNIINFFKKQFMTTFQTAADKQLTFNKSCRFSHVRLSKDGVLTDGHLWKLGKKINLKLQHRFGITNSLSAFERRILH